MMDYTIPKKSGASFHIDEGESFEVTNPEGEQIADLVAFNKHDLSEKYSQAYTRHMNNKLRISTGDSLYTTEGNPILTITSDDTGVHDIMYGPCNEWMLTDIFPDEPGGCRENLYLAAKPEGIEEEDVPNTLNVFQKSMVKGEDQELELGRSPADPGDAVEFEADQDAIVAVSACSAAGEPNGDELTSIGLRIPEYTTIHGASVQNKHNH
jgi:uncharacterized protein YcgI (DUF1989 family)